MDTNSIIILPEGSEIPESAEQKAEIIGFLQEDGSLKVTFNKRENGKLRFDEQVVFENMSKFFQHVGGMKKNV
jgi:predicted RNA-binding protein (virulence factor B family)